MSVLVSEFSVLRKLQHVLATVIIAIITNIIIVIPVPKQECFTSGKLRAI
jgi:hypothetical protein